MPTFHELTYGVRKLRSTPKVTQGPGVRPVGSFTVPSPQAAPAENSGVLLLLFAQLYRKVPGAVWEPIAPPVSVIALSLMVPPAVVGVGFPFLYSATPVVTVRN